MLRRRRLISGGTPATREDWEMRTSAKVAAALAVAAACGQPADARPLDHGRFGYQESIVVDWCGADAPFRNDFDVTGTFIGRVTGQDGNGGFRYSQTAHGEAIWTNLATGRTLTIVWNAHDQDLRVTDNGDGTGTVLWQESGNVNYFGPDGKFVSNAPGAFRVESLIDFNGTPGDPSDDTVISETLVRNVGHAPDASECEMYRGLTM
jgi:hypothetical protein